MDALNENNETPATLAVMTGSTSIIKYLLETNMDPNVASKGGSLLHLSCKYHHAEITKLLLVYKADLSQLDVMGNTPFNLITPNIYFQDNEDEDETEKSIRMYLLNLFDKCCIDDDTDLLTNILQTAKFSLSSTVEQPIAPLSIALKSNAFKVIEMLLDKGASIYDPEVIYCY